jgi:ABC-type polysaccharide/polyol phosphate transport system ATPase subunit
MESLADFCDRCIWLDGGKIRADGPTKEILAKYRRSQV